MIQLYQSDCLEVLKSLANDSVHAIVTDPPYGLAFMNKRWDYDVPSVEVWQEVLRVLKPGGHLLSFGGTRTYHRMVVNIEDAGFEIRDQIQWLYGSGFPKSHNLKDGWQGWGTALKPANEPIVLARKPLEKGLTVAENVLKWGCGAINVDGSRIGTNEKLARPFNEANNEILGKYARFGNPVEPLGRWPANLLLDEDAAAMLGETSRFFYVAKASKSERNAGLEGMPKKLGGAKSGAETRPDRPPNHHPTVKPIKLMQYLVKLITPPNGIVLDPFMGSGSTGVACKKLGFGFLGIEREQEYFEIAKNRINNT